MDVLPCLIVLVAAHCKQHIGQVCESGRGVGGVGSGNLALQSRVQQIFVALDLDVADEVGVDDEDTAVQHIAGDEAALVLVGVDDVCIVGGNIRLPQVLVGVHQRPGAAEQDICVGIVLFGLDTLDQFAGAGLNQLDVDAVFLLKQRNGGVQQTLRVGRVDHEVAAALCSSTRSGSGSSGRTGRRGAGGGAAASAQSSRSCDNTGSHQERTTRNLFHSKNLHFLPETFR